MKEPKKITLELIKAHGLTEEEYNRIKDILGRKPTFTELGIFSVMWSEHCSYKSSKPVSRRLKQACLILLMTVRRVVWQ